MDKEPIAMSSDYQPSPIVFCLFLLLCLHPFCPTQLFAQPINDDLSDALVVDLSSGTFTHVVSQGNATSEADEVECRDEPSWWYVFTPVATGDFLIRAEFQSVSNPNPLNEVSLGIYTGATHPLSEFVCLNNNRGAGRGEAEVLTLLANTTYYLRVAVPVSIPDFNINVRTTISPAVFTWTGAENNAWEEPENWDLGSLPTPNASVIIPDVNRQAFIGQDVQIGALLVEGEGLTVEPGAALTVAGQDQGITISENGRITVENNGALSVAPQSGPSLVINDGRVALRNNTTTLLQSTLRLLEGEVTVEGELFLNSPAGNGAEISNGQLECFRDGCISVSEVAGDGVQLGAFGRLRVDGRMTVSQTTQDGIVLEASGDVEVNQEAVLEVLNVGGNGINILSDNTFFTNQGTLTLAGAANLLTSGGTIENAPEAILRAEGTLASEMVFFGMVDVQPGNETGCLTFQEAVNLRENTLRFDLEGTTSCTEHDQITFAAAADITDAELVLEGDYLPVAGDTFVIISNEHSAPVSGTFAGLVECDTFLHNGVPLLISYIGGDGNDVVLYGDPFDTPPVNDDLANAVSLEGINGYAELTASTGFNGATLEVGEITCEETNSWWYAYTPAATAQYFIELGLTEPLRAGANNDLSLGVYTGSNHPLTAVTCIDNQPTGEQVTVSLQEGITYYLRVGARPKSAVDGNFVFIQQLPVAWTGAIDSDWYKTGNWQTNVVPGEKDLVLIPPATNAPILASGNVTLAGMEVESGGIFSLSPGASLNLDGAINGLDVAGEVNIAGDLTIENQAFNGLQGSGVLTVQQSGTLRVKGSPANWGGTLTGAGTIEMTEGAYFNLGLAANLIVEANGALTITDAPQNGIISGGTVDIRGNLVIANTVTGLFVTDGSFTVGQSGSVSITDCSRHGIDFDFGGPELVNNGQLSIKRVDANAIDGGTTINTATATFSVAGRVTDDVVFAAGSRLEPGASLGCVIFDQATDLSSTTIALEIEGTNACTEYDQIEYNDQLDFSDALLTLSGSYTPQIGDAFNIITTSAVDPPSGTFAGLAEGDTIMFNGVPLQIAYEVSTSSRVDVVLTAIAFDASPVNDDLANAILLEGRDVSVEYPASNGFTGASMETGEVDCSGTVSVWYAYTPTVTANYRVRALVTGTIRQGANNDMSLGVYTGADHPLTPVNCLDNNNLNGSGEDQSILFTAGETYYFRLGLRSFERHDAILVSIRRESAFWTGAVNSNWYEAGNWNTGRVPGPGENVVINDNAAPIAVIDTGSVSVADLLVTSTAGIRLNTGAALTLNGGEFGFTVGQGAPTQLDGSLSIANQTEDYGLILLQSDLTLGTTGSINLDGLGIQVVEATLAVRGTVNGSNALAEGVLLVEGNLRVDPAGTMRVETPAGSGLRTIAEDNRIEINGQLTLLSPGFNGVQAGQDSLLVGSSGVLTIRDAGQDGTDNVRASIDGTLIVTGSNRDAIRGNQVFRINAGGTLEVEGNVPSLITFSAGSRLSTGGPIGCAVFREEVLFDNAILSVQIDGPNACSGYNQLVWREFLRLNGASLVLSGDYVPQAGETFEIVNPVFDGSPSGGTFSGLPNGTTFDFNGALLEITYGTSNTPGGRNVLLTTLQGVNRASWTGAVDSDWYKPGNWANGAVPTANDDVLIEAGSHPAVLPSGAINVASLLLLNNGNFTVAEGASLILSAGTAGLVARSGQLTVNGTFFVDQQANGHPILNVNTTIGPNGRLIYQGTNGDVLVSKNLNCNGSLQLNDGPGLSLQGDGGLTVGTTGDCQINRATGVGILHNGAGVVISGKLTVANCGGDGILGTNFIGVNILPTAEATFRNNAGHGMAFLSSSDYPITNRGVLTITGSGLNAINRGIFLNQPGATLRVDGKIDTRWIEEENFRLQPGSPTGCLTFEDGVSLEETTLSFVIDGTMPCTEYGQIIAPRGLSIDAATLELSGDYTPQIGDAFTLLTRPGSQGIFGTLAGLPEGAVVEFNGVFLQITYAGGSDEDIVLTAVQSVNEAIWTGAVDRDWHTPGNWQNGILPSPTSAVLVPEGVTNQPVIDSLENTIAEIRIEAGNTFTIGEAAKLTVSGGMSGVLLFGDSLTVAGDLLVNNQSDGGNGINMFTGALRVTSTGSVQLDGLSIGNFLSVTITIAGTVNINNSPSNGINLVAVSTVIIEGSGVVNITNPSSSGVFVNGTLRIDGALNVDGANNNGLVQSGAEELVIGPTGTVAIMNYAQAGITRTGAEGNIKNFGQIRLAGNGNAAIFGNTLANEAGAILRSDGRLRRSVSFAEGSSLFPGASPGCLTFQEAADLSGANITFDLEGTIACEDYDQIIVDRFSNFSGSTLRLVGDYIPVVNDVFTIVRNTADSDLVGTFAGLPEGTIIDFNGSQLEISYNNGRDVTLTAVAVLPLDLLSFSGEARDKTNLLSWMTANAVDFSHFEVERSPNGRDNWSVLAQSNLQASGAQAYIDQAPLPVAYYRLKMVDLDGTFTYSRIIYLENDSGATARAIKVYPNPSQGRFTVDLTSISLAAGTEGKLYLVDVQGREVWSTTVTDQLDQLTLSLPDPTPGIYSLIFQNRAGQHATQRVVIH